jgi:hypothetical protein
MGPCQELFGGVYGNIDIFFNMANCLGLARGSNATGGSSSGGSNSTNGGTPTTSVIPVSGGGKVGGKVERGLWVGMLVFQAAIGWVALNL